MAVIHISEEEAARNLHSWLEKVRAGAELSIDDGEGRIRILKVPTAAHDFPPPRLAHPRLISEILIDLRSRASDATLDDKFGDDLEAVIREGQNERFATWDAP